MKKNTIIRKIEFHEEKITKAIDDFQDFLDSIEDDDISDMADCFKEYMLDIMFENDTCSISDIKKFVENDYDDI